MWVMRTLLPAGLGLQLVGEEDGKAAVGTHKQKNLLLVHMVSEKRSAVILVGKAARREHSAASGGGTFPRADLVEPRCHLGVDGTDQKLTESMTQGGREDADLPRERGR